jgi:hypothetical protein
VLLLSVLDQSPVRTGSNAAAAVQETLDLAELADRVGYHRYWLAEHHATPGLAGSCPEILIGAVASRTARIRVGAGGVMLQELVIVTITHDPKARRRSYELLAEAMGLEARP